MKNIVATVITGVLVVLPATSGSAWQGENQNDAVAQDMAKLQGKWERTRRVGNRTVRSVKVIEGNKTTLTRFDPDGIVYWAHTSNFEIAIVGKVRIFTFFNLEVTAGASKGRKFPERVSLIYRVDDDTLAHAFGMLIGQENEGPRFEVWRRVRDEIAANTTPRQSTPSPDQPHG